MGLRFSIVGRVARIVSPLLFLLGMIAILNFWPNAGNQGEVPAGITAVTSTPLIPLPSGTSTAIATTTPPLLAPTATITPMPTATLPPDAVVRLLGPPADALFRTTDTITFYWQWPAPMEEGQFFQLILFTATEQIVLGQMSEPNLGTQFNLQWVAHQALEPELVGQWQIELRSPTGAVLRSSEQRIIRFLEP